MLTLWPCPECNRHVRNDEAACPFCEADLPAQPLPTPHPRIEKRLSRAALVALGGLLVACGGRAADSSDQGDGDGDGGGSNSSSGGSPTGTGGTPTGTGGTPTGTGGWEPTNSGGVYGVPPTGGWGGANPDDIGGAAGSSEQPDP